MTRNDELQGILVAGHPHSTACARLAQQGGKLSVGACRAVGNLLQRLPHTQLEGSALHPYGKVHLLACTVQVLCYLPLRFAQERAGRRGGIATVSQCDVCDGSPLLGEPNDADRSIAILTAKYYAVDRAFLSTLFAPQQSERIMWLILR